MTEYQNRIIECRSFNSSESFESSLLLNINDFDPIDLESEFKKINYEV